MGRRRFMNRLPTALDQEPAVKIAVTERAHELGITHPHMHHDGDAGIDLASMVDTEIQPQTIGMIPTGLIIELPNFGPNSPLVAFGEIQSRTGLARDKKLLPGPQIVDCGYVADKDSPDGLVIGMINHGTEPVSIKIGDRVAQMVVKLGLNPAKLMARVDVEDINYNTNRGSAGFGSTGLGALELGKLLTK